MRIQSGHIFAAALLVCLTVRCAAQSADVTQHLEFDREGSHWTQDFSISNGELVATTRRTLGDGNVTETYQADLTDLDPNNIQIFNPPNRQDLLALIVNAKAGCFIHVHKVVEGTDSYRETNGVFDYNQEQQAYLEYSDNPDLADAARNAILNAINPQAAQAPADNGNGADQAQPPTPPATAPQPAIVAPSPSPPPPQPAAPVIDLGQLVPAGANSMGESLFDQPDSSAGKNEADAQLGPNDQTPTAALSAADSAQLFGSSIPSQPVAASADSSAVQPQATGQTREVIANSVVPASAPDQTETPVAGAQATRAPNQPDAVTADATSAQVTVSDPSAATGADVSSDRGSTVAQAGNIPEDNPAAQASVTDADDLFGDSGIKVAGTDYVQAMKETAVRDVDYARSGLKFIIQNYGAPILQAVVGEDYEGAATDAVQSTQDLAASAVGNPPTDASLDFDMKRSIAPPSQTRTDDIYNKDVGQPMDSVIESNSP